MANKKTVGHLRNSPPRTSMLQSFINQYQEQNHKLSGTCVPQWTPRQESFYGGYKDPTFFVTI